MRQTEGGRRGCPERHREFALGELGADVGGVACLFEEVGVGVEGHAGAGVAEDAADLGDVEADVDDQVAGEGVAQVVETQPPVVAVETRLLAVETKAMNWPSALI